MRWSSKPHVTTTPTTTLAMATPPLTMPPPTATPRLSTSRCRSPTAPCLRSRSPRGSLLRQPTSHHVLLLPAATAAKSEALAAGSAPAATAEEGLAGSLQGIEVFDLSGKAVPIVDLWKDRKAVVAFARHFGCVLCRKRADLLASKQDVMEAADVALALIGPGTVDQAKAFSEQTKFRGEVYADPNHSSYDALKFAYGVTSTFTPLAGLKIIQLYMEGYRQDWELSFQENTLTRGGWQQGGLLVAGPGIDNILYIHKDKEAGDDPDLEDVLRACCS